MNMTVVSVDLDDTLIPTGHHYDMAIEELADYLHDTYDIPKQEVRDVQHQIDYNLLEQHGLEMGRFPDSFVQTLEYFVEYPSEQEKEIVRSFGHEVFKSENEYAEIGFIDGAEEMIETLSDISSELHLVTVGDEDAQWPKIEALGLEDTFTDIHIPGYEEGKGSVIQDIKSNYPMEHVYHIGNSLSSDVKPAIELGANAVYVPYNEEDDWLTQVSDDSDNLHEHENVHIFDCVNSFVQDHSTVFHHLD